MRKVLKYVGYFLLFFALYIGGTLLHGTLNDWQPELVIEADNIAEGNGGQVIRDSVISLLIWNMGYAGLGEESDFFFDSGGFFTDGGHMVRPTQEQMQKNLDGAQQIVASTEADFYLLQEVDRNSRRSYHTDQLDSLHDLRSEFAATYTANYRVKRVPLPILQPWDAYGKVEAGLATLSRWQAQDEKRYQLPGDFDWPTRIFQLDRCLLVSRFTVADEKELVLINAHLSAYDKGGVLKKQQMAFLQEFVIQEYEQGHYVIVGADWNQCPPFFQFDSFSPGHTDGYSQSNITADFVPEDWQWLYDPTTPSNRKLRNPYDPETSFRTVIDFYLVSPNIKAKRVKTIDYQFRFSDHQPVWAELELLR